MLLSEALGRAARDGTIWKKTTPEKRERPKRLVLKPWRLVALALVREKCQGGSSVTRLKERAQSQYPCRGLLLFGPGPLHVSQSPMTFCPPRQGLWVNF